jgi:coenzyme Q-binding protein COQ10
MRSALAIDIQAPPRLVFELARDVERWPALLPHYDSVRIEQRHADGSVTARMRATRPLLARLGYGIPVTWRARVIADAEAPGLSFRHLGGATSGMAVTWRIEKTDEGCRVTIEHVFGPRVPGWARFVDALFVRPIAGRTLASFKAIAEAADAASRRARSGRTATAKK